MQTPSNEGDPIRLWSLDEMAAEQAAFDEVVFCDSEAEFVVYLTSELNAIVHPM